MNLHQGSNRCCRSNLEGRTCDGWENDNHDEFSPRNLCSAKGRRHTHWSRPSHSSSSDSRSEGGGNHRNRSEINQRSLRQEESSLTAHHHHWIPELKCSVQHKWTCCRTCDSYPSNLQARSRILFNVMDPKSSFGHKCHKLPETCVSQ